METDDIITVKTRLSMLPYAELRKRAKENDIKANLKKEQLVESLARKFVGGINPVSLKKEKPKGPRRYTVAVSSITSDESSGDEGDDRPKFQVQSSVVRANNDSFVTDDGEEEEKAAVQRNIPQVPPPVVVLSNADDTNTSQKSLNKSRRSRRSAELNETFDGDAEGEEKLKEVPTSSGRDSNAMRREKILAEINERAAARLALDEKNEGASPARGRNAPIYQSTTSGGQKKTPGDGNRFKNAHEKLFKGMESIGDHLNKKQQRHLALTTAASDHLKALATPKTKSRLRSEMARKIPTKIAKKSPVRKQLPKKPVTAPGFKFDSPRTPGKLDFNFGAATPSRIQSIQQKKPGSAQIPVRPVVRKSSVIAANSPAVSSRTRQQPLRPVNQLNKTLPLAAKVKKPTVANVPKSAVKEEAKPIAVRGGMSAQRYTPYKGRIPKYVDTSKMSDAQVEQLKKMGGLKNVHATQTTSRIASATSAVKQSVQQKQAQGRSRLIDAKRQIKS